MFRKISMAASLTTESCDLTSCSKCHQLMHNPKSLPCLHSFCASCLENEVKPSTNLVQCLVCRQEFQLPAGGIESLNPLTLVQRLTEQSNMQMKLAAEESIACTACVGIWTDDTPDVKPDPPSAVARCTECDDYLCKRCVAIHRSQRALKDHPIFTFNEIRSGKIPDIGAFEQRICTKHKCEVLIFYCETCDVPICRQCVVIAHRHPDHKQTELEQAAKERKDNLQKLQKACEKNGENIITAIETSRKNKSDLDQDVLEAKVQIKTIVEKCKSVILQRLEEAQKLTEEELTKIEKERQTIIQTNDDQLMSINSRISTANTVTNKFIESGTDYEVASAYSNLKSTLHDLATEKSCMANVKFEQVKFEPNKQFCYNEPNIGRVAGCGSVRGLQREVNVPATFLKKYEDNSLETAIDVAITPTGNIAVTNHNSASVTVFNCEGIIQFNFQVNAGVDAEICSRPWCIQVSPDGLFYVTDTASPHVKIFDIQGTYKRFFYTVSPANVSYNTHGSSNIGGLCFNSKEQVLVGNNTHKFISCHSPDGTHVTSINVTIKPYFLAVTFKDHIVISSYCTNSAIQIIDHSGTVLYNIHKPSHVSSWSPAGVTAGMVYRKDEDESDLFVVDRQNGYAIYLYSASGKYVDTVTKDVSDIYSLTLSKDGKLLVVNPNCVKCFLL